MVGDSPPGQRKFSEADGWNQSSCHEGDFIGVRRSYDWGAGEYRVRIAPDGLEGAGEWFSLWITDLDAGETTWIGSLKFPLQDGEAKMGKHASSTIELYGIGPVQPIDIPTWHVSVRRPTGDGVPATWGSTLRKDNFSPIHSRSQPTHESSSTGSRKGKASLKPVPTPQQALEPRTRKIRISNPRPRQSALTQRLPSNPAPSKRPKTGRNTIASETRTPNERNSSGNTNGSKTKSPRKLANARAVPTPLSQGRPGARLVPKSTGSLAGRVRPPREQGKKLSRHPRQRGGRAVRR